MVFGYLPAWLINKLNHIQNSPACGCCFVSHIWMSSWYACYLHGSLCSIMVSHGLFRLIHSVSVSHPENVSPGLISDDEEEEISENETPKVKKKKKAKKSRESKSSKRRSRREVRALSVCVWVCFCVVSPPQTYPCWQCCWNNDFVNQVVDQQKISW